MSLLCSVTGYYEFVLLTQTEINHFTWCMHAYFRECKLPPASSMYLFRRNTQAAFGFRSKHFLSTMHTINTTIFLCCTSNNCWTKWKRPGHILTFESKNLLLLQNKLLLIGSWSNFVSRMTSSITMNKKEPLKFVFGVVVQ